MDGGEEKGKGIGSQEQDAEAAYLAAKFLGDQFAEQNTASGIAQTGNDVAAKLVVGDDAVEQADEPGIQGEEHQKQGLPVLGVIGITKFRQLQIVVCIILAPGVVKFVQRNSVAEDAAVQQADAVGKADHTQSQGQDLQSVPPGEGIALQRHGFYQRKAESPEVGAGKAENTGDQHSDADQRGQHGKNQKARAYTLVRRERTLVLLWFYPVDTVKMKHYTIKLAFLPKTGPVRFSLKNDGYFYGYLHKIDAKNP